ncbi:hypothetical protein B0H14DRAFT_3484147 [Mycena olivaceomarginata]|nr:hypothetical protein B0H14DRAFT_3484147 [Mycena olivaceomarginata]
MTVTAQYARQANRHAPPFAVPPSHEAGIAAPTTMTPERSGRVFESPTRAPCASLPPRRLVVLQSPFSCSPRSTPLLAALSACDYLPVLRTHIASIVFHRPERNTHESTPAAIDAAFPHTGPFSIHGVAPVTRLSLGTRLHNRRFSFYASSQQEGPGMHPDDLSQHRRPFSYRATFSSPSSTPSTPTALERRKRHAPRLPALLAVLTLQRDGSTCDRARHALEAATRARTRTTSTRSALYRGARTLVPPSHHQSLAQHDTTGGTWTTFPHFRSRTLSHTERTYRMPDADPSDEAEDIPTQPFPHFTRHID